MVRDPEASVGRAVAGRSRRSPGSIDRLDCSFPIMDTALPT